MRFEIAFTRTAADHVRSYRKYEQQIILDAIDQQLAHEPTTETRNRKRLGGNELSHWEMRVGDFRIFYDVLIEDERGIVKSRPWVTRSMGSCASATERFGYDRDRIDRDSSDTR
jgi:mRNA-degrading endonuclease RelE of RelBE toxin-antitoxin system